MLLMIAAGIVAIFGGLWAGRLQQGLTAMDRSRQLIDFTLVDRTGRTITRAELTNQFLVVNCVFTSCSLSCRVVNDRMEKIQRLVAEVADVRLVSLSVDPRTDTPAVLAQFADAYHADTNRWLFLTGDKPELYRLIETSFITRSPKLDGLVPGGFTGTDRILLVDPRGKVRHSFNGLSAKTPLEVVETIARLRNEHPRL